MSGQVEGFRITPARVGFFLSLVAAISVFKPAYTYFADEAVHETKQDLTISSNTQAVGEFRGEVKELKTSIDGLTNQVTRLTTVIEGERRRAFLTVPKSPLILPRDLATIEEE